MCQSNTLLACGWCGAASSNPGARSVSVWQRRRRPVSQRCACSGNASVLSCADTTGKNAPGRRAVSDPTVSLSVHGSHRNDPAPLDAARRLPTGPRDSQEGCPRSSMGPTSPDSLQGSAAHALKSVVVEVRAPIQATPCQGGCGPRGEGASPYWQHATSATGQRSQGSETERTGSPTRRMARMLPLSAPSQVRIALATPGTLQAVLQ